LPTLCKRKGWATLMCASFKGCATRQIHFESMGDKKTQSRVWLVGTESTFGIAGAFLVCLGIFAGALLWEVLASLWGLRGDPIYRALFSLSLVICFVLAQRPRLLMMSRWRPRIIDLLVGISCGLAVESLVLLLVSNPVKFLGPPSLSVHSLLGVAILGSILEEVLFRGVLLKSLRSIMPTTAAVALVVLLSLPGHPSHILSALALQLTFSIVYITMGDSLVAAMAAHISANLLVCLPVGPFFDRWHI
jgi:membrane protease YdiL (CAAX protease family)